VDHLDGASAWYERDRMGEIYPVGLLNELFCFAKGLLNKLVAA
jgi:hypothetical protein